MNADRLHALLRLLRDDFNRTKLPHRMDQLSSSLQQAIQNPNNNKAVGNSVKEVLEGVEDSEIDDLSPAWQDMIREIGFQNSLGSAIKERVNDSLRQVDVTPTIVKEEIDELSAELDALNDAITNGISALETLSIGFEELNPGECELGFMVPRDAIDYQLDAFASECKEFDFIFSTFSEIITGDRKNYRINTISSSDLSVFLEAAPEIAALVAITIERIVALYKSLLEIKKLRSEMLAQNLPKEAFAPIDDHVNSMMDAEIDKIADEVLDEHNEHDPGRANELKTALRKSLRKLANRIDKGFHVEVRVGALPEPSDEEESVDEQLRENAEAIRKAAKPLQFIRAKGEPILRLLENSESE